MKKLKIVSIATLILGIVVLAVGGAFFIIKQNAAAKMGDADYLVQSGAFIMNNSDGAVEWDFTEIGKGKLTTNNHTNDYDFAWALQDDKLKIRTDWLYELDNEYTYQLDQSSGVLTLTSGDNEYKFTTSSE